MACFPKVNKLTAENKELKARVADLESTLAIVQTAQKWSEENSMTPEQAAKVKEARAPAEACTVCSYILASHPQMFADCL